MPVPRTPDPVPSPPLRRQEAERRLRNAIVRGDLAPGERLTEDDLAAWLGVSRTPVREALSRLAAAGLVTIDANRGARVAPLEPAEMLDLVQVSRQLVLLAQRLAAERALDEELEAMRTFHERRLAALADGDVERAEEATLAFHTAILAASRSHELGHLYALVFPRLDRVFRVAYPEWFGPAGAAIDGALLAAVESRHAEAVVRESSRAWDTLEDRIRARVSALAAASIADAAAGGPDGAADAMPARAGRP